MKILPIIKKWVVFIDQKRVVKLLFEFLPQCFQAGKIDNELIYIEAVGAKPESEASTIPMHESAVTVMSPLTMTAGEPIEKLNGFMHS